MIYQLYTKDSGHWNCLCSERVLIRIWQLVSQSPSLSRGDFQLSGSSRKSERRRQSSTIETTRIGFPVPVEAAVRLSDCTFHGKKDSFFIRKMMKIRTEEDFLYSYSGYNLSMVGWSRYLSVQWTFFFFSQSVSASQMAGISDCRREPWLNKRKLLFEVRLKAILHLKAGLVFS